MTSAPHSARSMFPCFAAWGSLDPVVQPQQASELLRSTMAQEDRNESARNEAEVHLYDGLNHLLMPATTGSPAEYATLTEAISEPLWDDIIEFMMRH